MVNNIENTHYPLRPSEEVKNLSFLEDVKELEISDDEREKLKELDNSLFEEVDKIQSTKVGTHLIYPEAFVDAEGAKIFAKVYLNREANEGELFSVDEVKNIFYNTNLDEIDKDLRNEANSFSAGWVRNKFKKDFIEANGQVAQIANPVRIVRVVNPEKLKEKMSGYRDFKKEIKD